MPQPSVQDTPLSMIHDPDWAEDLGQRIFRMATDDNGIREARLRLDPPSLGTLDIQLRIEDNKLSVQFQSASPQVREMIMDHVERLRASLNGSELNLVDVDVSSGQDGQKQQEQTSGNTWLADSGSGVSGLHDDGTDDTSSLIRSAHVTAHFAGRSLVSTYA